MTLHPLRSLDLQWQLVVFIAVEHFLMVVGGSIDAVVPESPPDVVRIDDYNAKFAEAIFMQHLKDIQVPHKDDAYAKVDIALKSGEGLETSREDLEDLDSDTDSGSGSTAGSHT